MSYTVSQLLRRPHSPTREDSDLSPVLSPVLSLVLSPVLSSVMIIAVTAAMTSGCADSERRVDASPPPVVSLAGSQAPIGGFPSGGTMNTNPIAGASVSGGGVMIGGESAGAVVGGAEAGSLAGDSGTAGALAGDTGGDIAGDTGGDAGGEIAGTPAGDDLPPDPRVNAGWIGGPCTSDRDCDYEDGLCITEDGDYPRGMCTQPCDRFCPDRDGLPVTFCIDDVLMTSGACVQRCDYIAFSGSGCRPGYSCVTRARTNDLSTTNGVCLPTSQVGEPDPVEPPPGSSECIQRLAALGVNFEYRGNQSESAGAGVSCMIEDAVRVQNPINGVVYRYIESSNATALYGSCELMLAIYDLSTLLREYNIVEVGHIGTYNCRVISGTNTVSRHGYGDALDIGSLFDTSGDEYNLIQHWEHDTTSFSTDKARILYEIGRQMHTRDIFNIVLTPNYNAAHDNHFHVDLTPGSDYHGKMDEETHVCGNESP